MRQANLAFGGLVRRHAAPAALLSAGDGGGLEEQKTLLVACAWCCISCLRACVLDRHAGGKFRVLLKPNAGAWATVLCVLWACVCESSSVCMRAHREALQGTPHSLHAGALLKTKIAAEKRPSFLIANGSDVRAWLVVDGGRWVSNAGCVLRAVGCGRWVVDCRFWMLGGGWRVRRVSSAPLKAAMSAGERFSRSQA